jgi:hypothetical protein
LPYIYATLRLVIKFLPVYVVNHCAMHTANEKMAEKQDWLLRVGRLAYWQGKNWQIQAIWL